MSPTLAALNGLLLVLAWNGESGRTYTVQTSTNLIEWTTLPFVFDGSVSDLSIAFDALTSPFFTRLRASHTGDTNENGLPDHWEWSVFGRLDVDPDGDPDEDGESTFNEWLAQSDPLDFYNGQSTYLQLASGREWLVPTGKVSEQALTLSLKHSNGRPWAHAPVHLRLASGRPALLQEGDQPATAVPEILVYTDSLGRLDALDHAIHVLGDKTAHSRDVLTISAGSASAEVTIRSLPVLNGQPPRNLKSRLLEDGRLEVSWEGSPSNSEAFIIQEINVFGEWVQTYFSTSASLPTPDSVTGRYRVTLNPN